MLEYRLCCLICAESDKYNFVDCRRFICRTVFSRKQWYIHCKSENNFWSIAPSLVDIYLVMSAITWAQTTVCDACNLNCVGSQVGSDVNIWHISW